MCSFRKNLVAEELSEKIVSLISDSKITSTVNHCESAWRNGDSWCRERAFGPFCCNTIRVSGIITDIFDTIMPQPRYCFIRDVNKVTDFPDSLNSERSELKECF